jgi:hypothetical protein
MVVPTDASTNLALSNPQQRYSQAIIFSLCLDQSYYLLSSQYLHGMSYERLFSWNGSTIPLVTGAFNCELSIPSPITSVLPFTSTSSSSSSPSTRGFVPSFCLLSGFNFTTLVLTFDPLGPSTKALLLCLPTYQANKGPHISNQCMVLKGQKVRLGAYVFQEPSDLLYFHRVLCKSAVRRTNAAQPPYKGLASTDTAARQSFE